MDDDTGLLFDLPKVGRKKVSAAFDGGRMTSDGGVALLALADRRQRDRTPYVQRPPKARGRRGLERSLGSLSFASPVTLEPESICAAADDLFRIGLVVFFVIAFPPASWAGYPLKVV